MKSSLLLAISLGLILSACGSGSERSESYSYSYDIDGCKTGEHKLNSKEALCQALKDERLNNGCASLDRKAAFEGAGCPGQFRETTTHGIRTDEIFTQVYSYEFEQNGCKTGRHKFEALGDLCEGLKDETLNRGCARMLRERAFESYSCPGEFSDSSR